MKKNFIGLLLFFIPVALFGQGDLIKSYTISPTLLPNANSIKREEKIEFEIKDFENARMKVHQVITVLNAGGEDELYFQNYSDEFRKLEDAEIKVYNSEGKLLNVYKRRELRSMAVGEGLVRDGQVVYFRVAAPSYPITVQYDYDVKYKGTLDYPDYWIATSAQSVENSSFTATVPEELDMRFKSKNLDIKPQVTTLGKNKVYTWQVKNLAAIDYEEGAARGGAGYPQVMMAPNKFSMDGYDGDLSSWKNFGLWYGNLARTTAALPDAAVLRLNALVKDAGKDKEKVKIIYKYLQNNFRYVSIQLGIGGYRPFPATYVDQKKYGDCKALSNYTQACLAAVGIKSYQALINAQYNREAVDPLFPHNNFNHVILCVPLNKDTTWLECTSTTNDFGSLGSFTENKNALLITPEGGILVSTPRSVAKQNTLIVKNVVNLNDDGSGEALTNIHTTGEYRQDIVHHILNEKKDDQLAFLVNQMGFLQPDAFELNKKTDEFATELDLKLFIDKVPDFTAGSKMFLHPRIYKIWSGRLPEDSARSRAYYFEHPFIKYDTTVYHLPENYTVENLPKARDKSFDFGSFKSSYTYDEDKNEVTSIAILRLDQHIIPAEKYYETKKFFSNVIDEYTEKIIIKKK